jgi:hypothetical protein
MVGHKQSRRKKIMFTCYLTQEQADGLRDLHKATQIPIAVLIRNGIDHILAKRQDDIRKYRMSVRRAYRAS